MLAFNEALQKTGIESKVLFSWVRYASSGSILALLTEKANVTMLLPQRLNLLIWAIKTINYVVVGEEILEQWQCFKVYGMSLERYMRPGKMGLLKRKVESSTGILLQATSHWFINKDQLREKQKTNNKCWFVIAITVSNKNVAKQLMASGLQFGGVVTKVEKFWNAGFGSVCIKCYEIGHERLGSCGDRLKRCVIYAGKH